MYRPLRIGYRILSAYSLKASDDGADSQETHKRHVKLSKCISLKRLLGVNPLLLKNICELRCSTAENCRRPHSSNVQFAASLDYQRGFKLTTAKNNVKVV